MTTKLDEKYKEVNEAEYRKFIKRYPAIVESAVNTLCDPPRYEWHDVTLGVWPDCTVAYSSNMRSYSDKTDQWKFFILNKEIE